MRPPSFTLSLRALVTLPYRLCNPPPAAGHVRSCKVTPLIKVTLDDVLNKKHLPPLTLKDFEEWLVFVEGTPQYLYFILWLKEYEARYAAWLAESGCALPASPSTSAFDTPPSAPDLSYVNLIPSSPALALFFTRAKQTFLDAAPGSPYALGPAALLALAPSTHSLSPSIPAFTSPNEHDLSALPPALAAQPHPHPRELAPLAAYARRTLKASLDRFAETACQNVGSRRAWCGIAGGTVIALALGVLPAFLALFFAPSRWWRAVGLLGCWIGGTVVVSSFHGICMMIYVFGDLRQLRSFELARPAISNPRAIARARPRLKSLLTRTPEGTATGTGTGTASSAHEPSTPPAPTHTRTRSTKPRIPPPIIIPSKGKAKDRLDGPGTWSASQTSTGTPVVHFGPGAFRVDVGAATVESDMSGSGMDDVGTGSGGVDVGSAQSAGGGEEEEDFGIEISPAYYYSTAGAEAESARRESASAGRMGLVKKWVLGGTAGERSHAGTFGVRSWRGGLGSLPGHSGADPEKARDVAEPEGMLTAEFITHDYPAAPAPAPVEKPVPVAFDFDKLPAVRGAPSPRTSTFPSTVPATPPSVPSPPLSPPPPALYAHPGAHLTSPSPPPPSPAVKDRQWWDTCPRHPAVEASLKQRDAARPLGLAIRTQAQIRAPDRTRAHTSFSAHTLSPSTLSASPASSEFHSRLHVPAAGPYAFPAASATATAFPSPAPSPNPGTWRTRFRRVTAVPAFGPLTRVLEPAVSRGQWEIVVRSAAVAALGAWLFVGCLVALPEVR